MGIGTFVFLGRISNFIHESTANYSDMFLTFIVNMTFGQSGFTTTGGANFLGYGRARVNIAGIESMYLNQAGLTEVKNFSVDISAERRYNLSDLTNLSFAAAKSFKFGTIGLMVSNFGFTEYNEQKFGLAYARKLNKSISLGGQFDMLRYNVAHQRQDTQQIVSFLDDFVAARCVIKGGPSPTTPH